MLKISSFNLIYRYPSMLLSVITCALDICLSHSSSSHKKSSSQYISRASCNFSLCLVRNVLIAKVLRIMTQEYLVEAQYCEV